MFRSTTVALDMSTGDPELLTSYTEGTILIGFLVLDVFIYAHFF